MTLSEELGDDGRVHETERQAWRPLSKQQRRLLQTDGGRNARSEGPQSFRPWGPEVVTQKVRFRAE